MASTILGVLGGILLIAAVTLFASGTSSDAAREGQTLGFFVASILSTISGWGLILLAGLLARFKSEPEPARSAATQEKGDRVVLACMTCRHQKTDPGGLLCSLLNKRIPDSMTKPNPCAGQSFSPR